MKLFITIASIFSSLLTPSSVLAAEDKVGKIDPGVLKVPTDINLIIGGLVTLIYGVAGLIFFFMFILGGIRYLSAGGDEKAVMAARATLTQAFIGLIIVVAAFLITQLIFTIFGIEGLVTLG